jgi:hypothetical protein
MYAMISLVRKHGENAYRYTITNFDIKNTALGYLDAYKTIK